MYSSGDASGGVYAASNGVYAVDDEDGDDLLRAEEQFAEDMQAGLSDDAPWKRIQQNTFTRWANEHLKVVNRQIVDLQYDLSDGLLLIALIEILSQKKLPRHNKKTTFRSQKLENVSVALDFLENNEQIKLVNIDASHIVDGRLKLILGLIWTLILHYYISLPRWESVPSDEQKPGRDPTPKQKLMGWVKNMLPPDLPITNFTTDWNDGRAIGALVDACAPGLYPDWVDHDPRDALKNTRDAMDLADEWLGIPQLIRPEEMIDPNVDDRSMMTYLSQYPSAKVRMGAPLRPKLNAALTNCYGKGIEPTGNFVAEPTDFFVETKQAGVGRLSVILINPRGQQEPCSIALQNDPNRTFKCTYTPSMEGQYKAIVKYADTEVPNSPFSPYIDRHPANVNECRAYGPGLEGQVGVDKPTWFEVDHSGAGPGRLDGSVVDPIYLQEIPIQIKPVDDGKSRCEYTPRMEGRHRVNLNYDGQPIPGSPFIIEAARAEEPIHFQAYGPGIQPKGVLVDDNAEFTVAADQIPAENILVTVLGPDGYEVPSSAVKSSPQKFACSYVPKQPGPHRVLVTYMGSHIPNSPFNVFVDAPSVARTAEAPERVRAYGPGLQTGTVRKPSTFVVETNGNPADLSFSIEGPDKVDMQCQDNHDGTVDVSYVPAAPGDHEIHVLNKGKDIQSSPFTAWIEPLPAHTAKQHPATPSEVPSKVRVYGPGVEPGNKVNNPTHFVVDCSEAGPGDISVALTDPRGRDVELRIDPLDNAFNVAYTPLVPGPHTVAVLCGNQEIAQSPIIVDILPGTEKVDLSKIYPEEYNPNPIVNQPNVIKINTQRAGPVDPQAVDADVTPVEPAAGAIPSARRRPSGKADVVPTGTGFGINYSVPAPGPYDVTPCVHGVPLEPIRVDAVEPVNPANVHVYGPGLVEGKVNRPAEFTVDTAGAGPGELRVAVEGHSKPRLTREDNSDDESCRVTYVPTSPGEHNISVLFDDQHVPGSPFHPNISPDQDVSRVRAYGPGVDPAKALNVGVPTEFTVDAQPIDKTGAGDVRCSVISPRGSQANAQVFNNRNGSYSVKYAPHEPGNLDVDVRYDGNPIPGSPFPVVSNAAHVEDGRPYQVRPSEAIAGPAAPSGQVRCFGPGLEGAYTKEPTEFTIDTSDAPGLGQLNVTIHGHGDAPLTMKNKMDNLCVIEYVPSKPGQYQISVTFNDQPIQGSPFSVAVCDRLNENQVFVGMPDEPMHVGEPFELNIDGRRAGPGVPAVSVIDPYGAQHSVPVQPVAAGRTVSGGGEQYLADFTPSTPGVHQFRVTWSGRPVPSCPFNVEAVTVFDVNQISVAGPGVMRAVGATVPTSFTINTNSRQYHDINVNIRGGPNNSTVRNVLSDNHDGTYTVHYVPPGELGIYSISVLCGKQHVPGSPYSISVVPCGDPSKCRISGSGIRTSVPIGQQCIVHVDASDAGHGAVTATIVSQTSGAPLEFDIIESEDTGAYDIIYVPSCAGVYAIQIYFGGQPIPNGSFVVQAGVDEHYTISQADYQKQFAGATRAHEPINFRLPVGGSISDVSAEVHTPSYRIVTPIIQDNHDGTISIKYHPNEPGEHVLSVYYQGIPVQGSPYRFTVDQVHDGYVTAYGPGLSGGISGQPCNFKIITKDAGTGSLAVAVEGPSKAEIRCKDNKDGTCDATYWPMAPGDYVVTVKYGGKHIAGSPFRARISQAGEYVATDQRMQVLGTSSIDFSDAARVRAYGPGLDEAFVNVANNFIVDSREAGNGSLSIAIEGPSKANIYCPSNEDGTCHVTYKVSEPGRYIINIKFAESSVPGSPFTVNVAGPEMSGGAGRVQPLPSLTQSDSAQFDRRMYRSFVLGDTRVQSLQMQSNVSTSSSRVGSMCQLCIPIPGVQSKDLYAFVTAPSSESRPCEVVDLDEQCKSIRFTPMEVGAHLVNITRASDRTHIGGSPYQFTVGTSAIQHDGSGAHNVRVSGTGVERGIANVPCEFNVYTRESGPGSLVITVEGPTNAEINFQEVQDGIGLVSYTCPGPGEYSVVVKFNEEHVPNSPFTVHIEPNPSDERCITIEDIHMPGGRQMYQANVPISFRLSSKQGVSYTTHVEAHVVSPSAVREPCQVQYKRENGQDFHVISFVPKEVGMHRVTVVCDGREIAGCPMEFSVGAVSASGTTRGEPSSDSAKVTAHGRGLYTGTVDQNCEFFVDTSKAGTGLLAVVVEGPSKVQLDCKEARGGYNISFFASAPGNYSVAIQFAGQPIPGSPFTCRMVDDDMGHMTRQLMETNLDAMSGRQQGTLDTTFLSSDQSRTFGSTSSIRQQQTISSYSSPGRHQMGGDGSSRWSRQQAPGVVTAMSPGWTYTKAGGDATMSGQSQPQKVRTYGSGIVRAKRDEQTEFTVDATAAGRNMLMVGILGPTRPCEEVIIKHLGKNVYTVSYVVRETGNYVLIVKWGESHIPGSPFYIEVP